MASKVSFFFHLWKLWLKHGDHGVLGNSRVLTVANRFVSQQCFLDVQMSCHYVVFLVMHFQNKYPHLSVPLHLTGSDACEIFFSKIGGMVGLERAYDFHELVNCANTFNHLSSIEYGENGLKFGKVHNKMTNIWAEINSLEDGETLCDLGDYSSVSSDIMIIEALKEGLVEAQRMLNCLNMAPSAQASRDKKIWFKTHWEVERKHPKHLAFIPGAPIYGEDGDGEVLREQMRSLVDDEVFKDTEACDVHVEVELSEDDVNPIVLAEMETRNVLAEMLSTHENQVVSEVVPLKVIPVVEYGGHQIFKSTLVSQLNANHFLSKDRLTRVRNSMYFNNFADYLSATSSSSTCLLGLGSNCGVYFVQRSSIMVSSTVKAAARRHSRSRDGQCGVPSSCLQGVDKGTWWVGRVQWLRKKVGTG